MGTMASSQNKFQRRNLTLGHAIVFARCPAIAPVPLLSLCFQRVFRTEDKGREQNKHDKSKPKERSHRVNLIKIQVDENQVLKRRKIEFLKYKKYFKSIYTRD